MNEENKNLLFLPNVIATEKRINTFQGMRELSKKFQIYPSLWKKVVAFGIDFSTILAIQMWINFCYATFLDTYLFMLSTTQKAVLYEGSLTIQVSVLLTIYLSYFIFCNYTLEGKTLGKKIMKLRSISDDFIFDGKAKNASMTLSQAVKRSFALVVCYLSFGTFFTFSFFSEDKRGLQDISSGTRTVTDDWLNAIQEQRAYQADLIFIDIKSLKTAA